MNTDFQTLRPTDTLAEAVNCFYKASAALKRKVFGLMVTNETGSLAGILSMYDILMLIQPKHIHIWGEMDDLDPNLLFDDLSIRVRSIRVGDIMTADVITIEPDTHIMVIVDLMIRKHIRRIPVIEDGKIIGIVYISDVFYYLLQKLIK
ncbi:MAG: CBS domain-containing protein [Desulfobacterales bacterium]|nr:CBS domain-containing protein [Desulfobacterales bacterium]